MRASGEWTIASGSPAGIGRRGGASGAAIQFLGRDGCHGRRAEPGLAQDFPRELLVAVHQDDAVLLRERQRVLDGRIPRAHDQGLTGDEAIMVAFEENARDLARVGGN